MSSARSRVSLGDLIDAGLLKPGQELHLRRRGLNVNATVTSDGLLMVAGETYRSPSTAANAVLRGSSNGWITWRVEIGDKWLPIAQLRDRLSSADR